jgi:formylglycine-generating enzyme required for sulfatase activity
MQKLHASTVSLTRSNQELHWFFILALSSSLSTVYNLPLSDFMNEGRTMWARWWAVLSGVLLASGLNAAPPTLSVDLGGMNVDFVLIPAGSFRQGSPATEAGRKDDETPREVKISSEFYLSKYPITKKQFARFVGELRYVTEAEKGDSGGYGFDGKQLVQAPKYNWKNPGFAQTDEHPVVLVTYNDCRAFLRYLQRKAERVAELPTEAQWEYAARAGATTAYPNGNTPADLDKLGYPKSAGTHPVGQKAANAWGLYDLVGHVHQWCRDLDGPYEGETTDPLRPETAVGADKARYILRGGSFLKDAAACRSAARYRNDPGSRNADNGFRVVLGVNRMTAKEEGKLPLVQPIDPAVFANAKPAVASTPSADSSSFYGLMCCFSVSGIAVAGLGALFWLAKRGAVGVDPPAPGSITGITAQPGEDGFTLRGERVTPGTVVRYRCWVRREERNGEVTITSTDHRQLVYTGGPPTQIVLVSVQATANSAGEYYDTTGTTSPLTSPPPPPRPGHRTSASPSDYDPPAY